MLEKRLPKFGSRFFIMAIIGYNQLYPAISISYIDVNNNTIENFALPFPPFSGIVQPENLYVSYEIIVNFYYTIC